ncbi:hypothetical protein DLM_2483 [Aquitalea magnusonii]|uniref:ABC-type transport auxiliary lipoprotein component domain-containing protein n=1 Tax=Aquitalea magnusonii TaxID=332411 RepID=A0A3G9GDZ3_9NEIS|nr:PqiC family protein [Aquitalea magnusonii]BBF86090.1 hypothetical protein DLM_2483 [Aquitalea magnusonii]
MNKRMLTCGIVLCSLLLAACSSAPIRYHQLRASLPGGASQQPGAVLLVEQVSLPAGTDRPQLLLEDEQNQPRLQEQDYWTASLSRLLTQAVAGNLAEQLRLSTVYAAPQLSLAQPDLSLQLDVRAFRLLPGQGAQLTSAWRVLRPGTQEVLLRGYFSQQQAQTGQQSAQLVAAQQQLVNALSQQIATALAAHADWLYPPAKR